MRAVICRSFGGPSSLEIGEIDGPRPEAGQVLVDVHAASISFMDCLMVSGRYQLKPELPFVPGTDAAGVVAAVGDGVTGLAPGDRVACGSWFGAYAEQMIVDEHAAVRLPESIDFATGSTIRHCYSTAHYVLVNRTALKPGETVFVTGAAGGVGLALVDVARHLGARVIAGVGSPAKFDRVREYGASDVIDYNRESVRDRIRELTGGEGVDVCVDNVGGDLFQQMTRLMAFDGRLVPLGFTSGTIPSVPMNLPLLKHYSIVGAFHGAWSRRHPQQAAAADDEVVRWVAQKRLRPCVDRILPLDGFADGMRRVESREAQGRVVLAVR
jgi:NADPH:quinone reductase